MCFKLVCVDELNVSAAAVTTLVGTVLTFLAIVVALLKEEFQRLWRKPKLNVSIRTALPDCNNVPTRYIQNGNEVTGNCYYLRLWIYNEGNLPATNVQVYANRLLRETNNTFVQLANFLPMNLRWSHTLELFRERIAPKMGRHCDLGHVADPALKAVHGEQRPDVNANDTLLCLSLESLPNTLVHLLGPGRYRLELTIAADNCDPKRKTVIISLTGRWFQTEAEMFTQGISLSIE